MKLTDPQLALLRRIEPGHTVVCMGEGNKARTAYKLHCLGLAEFHASCLQITPRGQSFLLEMAQHNSVAE